MKTGAADHSRILACARQWAGAKLALATVVETWKSAPCPLGSHMLIHEDGRFAGSVSGGCVEGDVLQAAAQAIETRASVMRRYGVADGAAWEVGLPCGGDIVVLIQPVGSDGFSMELFGAIEAARAEGEALTVSTDLNTGLSVAAERDGDFQNIYYPQRRLIIVGAVEIAVSLAKIASLMDIDVIVIDPRECFLTAERFPFAVLDDRWPDEAVAEHKPDSRTAVVTLSHDVKIDDPALIAALSSNAAYVAALGSKKAHAARCARLAETGMDASRIDRIEGPAGVAINAISAPEIALSIAGGMVRAFNLGLR